MVHTPSSYTSTKIFTRDIAIYMQDAYMCVCVSVCMKIGILVYLFTSERVYHVIWTNSHKPSLAFFTDNRYICAVLYVGLVMVVGMDLGCSYHTLSAIFINTYIPNLSHDTYTPMYAHAHTTCDAYTFTCQPRHTYTHTLPYVHVYMSYRIVCHVLLAVMMAVLPGRITRRGLTAAEESINLMVSQRVLCMVKSVWRMMYAA